MAELAQYTVNGISQACVYILLASGLTLIFGVLRVPNFAQGHLFMIGAYAIFFFTTSSYLNYWLALVLTTISMGILGLLIDRLIFGPVENAPEINKLVAALGLLMILEGLAMYFFGSYIRSLITPYSRLILSFAGISIKLQRLFIVMGTIVVMGSLQFFIKRTTIGAALEATAQNRVGAMLCGIETGRFASMAFVIGTALAGVAGALVGPAVLIMPTMGMGPLLIAFSAVIFGGLGSVPGAILGAIVMGLVESLASGYISGTYSGAFIFGIMILVLLIKPTGLMGRSSERP